MRYGLKKLVISMPILRPLRLFIEKREVSEWKKNGRPLPPPHVVKEIALREYARKFGLSILVETGSYLGDMVAAMMEDFETIYSIELSRELYEKAVRRFAGFEKVKLIQGDSGEELRKIVGLINRPTLFWLDGHYSAGVTAKAEKETPINEELETLLSLPDRRHVIVIDDARCFNGDPAYPTFEEVVALVKARRPDLQIAVKDDSIRITPALK